MDGGTGGIGSAEAVRAATPEIGDEYLAALEASTVPTWNWSNIVTDPATGANVIGFSTGYGDGGYPVFVSPHYYYPSDRRWTAPGGAVEALMGRLGVFARKGPLSLDGFEGSGADWPERFKPLLRDCETVVASPHKVYGTASNDLVLQLRKRRIDKVILAGPAGNLCVEAHLRDFLEHGFEVAMVRDATAGTRNEEGDGYRAARPPGEAGSAVRRSPGR